LRTLTFGETTNGGYGERSILPVRTEAFVVQLSRGKDMRRLGTLLVGMTLFVAAIGAIAVPYGAAASADRYAGNEAELKAVLADLSSDLSGPHLVTLTEDIVLLGTHAEYSGTQDLTIEGDGHSISGAFNSRVFYFPISGGVAVTLQNLIIENGRSTSADGGYGGGIAVNAYEGPRPGGDLVVINSVVRNNEASGNNDGGGISVVYGGDLTLIDSMVLDNHAEDAGGVVGSNVLVINSTIANNTTDSGRTGGGIFGGETITLVNSTVTGNSARYGSGVYSRGPLDMVYSTVAGNTGGTQVQTETMSGGAAADLTAFGSVVAYPASANCLIDGATTSTYSYDDGATCGFTDTTDISNGSDPLLATLADNGGPTLTRLPGASLVDQIPTAACDATVTTDQRGVTRPQGTGCDIGAVEIVQNQPPAADANGPYTANEGDTVVFDGSGSTDLDGDPLSYTWTLTAPDGGFNPATGVAPSHLFVDNYSGTVNLTVEDRSGGSGTANSSVTVSNVAPSIDTFTITPALIAVGESVSASATFSDPGTVDTHGADWDWDDGTTTDPGTLTQGAGFGLVADSHTYDAAGVYAVELTVADDDGGIDSQVYQYVIVYDPSAGFVTGGGWFYSEPGNYLLEPELEGKATFGFNSKYKKGATVPTGNTEFQFQTADLNFHSSSYDWLVVTGSNFAKFKGTGTLNGEGVYKFQIWAGDGNPDTFRIKIWYEDGGEVVVYDNGTNQAIGGGSIVIHTKKTK
jgi:hypothetical protein